MVRVRVRKLGIRHDRQFLIRRGSLARVYPWSAYWGADIRKTALEWRIFDRKYVADCSSKANPS